MGTLADSVSAHAHDGIARKRFLADGVNAGGRQWHPNQRVGDNPEEAPMRASACQMEGMVSIIQHRDWVTRRLWNMLGWHDWAHSACNV